MLWPERWQGDEGGRPGVTHAEGGGGAVAGGHRKLKQARDRKLKKARDRIRVWSLQKEPALLKL